MNTHLDPIPLTNILATTNQPELQWLIPNLLPQGLTLLLGQPRLGKSWLALHLALSIALGDPILDHFPTPQANVLYLGLQDTSRRISIRTRKLLGDHPTPNTFFWSNQWTPSQTDNLHDLNAWLIEHPNTRLLVIDSLDQLHRPGLTTEQELALLHQLKALSDRHQLAILIVHQLSAKACRDPLNELTHTPTLAAADALLILKRNRGQADATLQLTGTDLPEQELALQLPQDSMRWTLLGPAADYRLSQERQDILAVLQEYDGGPLRPKEIATLLHKDVRAVTKLLFDMSHAAQLCLTGRGQYMLAKNDDKTEEHRM